MGLSRVKRDIYLEHDVAFARRGGESTTHSYITALWYQWRILVRCTHDVNNSSVTVPMSVLQDNAKKHTPTGATVQVPEALSTFAGNVF